MASLIRMPQKGLSEDSAILSKRYVKEGDTVKKGDFVFAIETGKATFDVESEEDGTVLKCIGEEGDEVPVKALVCVVGQPGRASRRRTMPPPLPPLRQLLLLLLPLRLLPPRLRPPATCCSSACPRRACPRTAPS